jgi:hypothetical protein
MLAREEDADGEPLIRGRSDGTFGVGDVNIDRAKFVTMIIKILNMLNNYQLGTDTYPIDFTEIVGLDNYTNTNIVCEKNILRGYPDSDGQTLFGHGDPITGGQAAKILGRAYLRFVDPAYPEESGSDSLSPLPLSRAPNYETEFDFVASEELIQMRRSARPDERLPPQAIAGI